MDPARGGHCTMEESVGSAIPVGRSWRTGPCSAPPFCVPRCPLPLQID